MVPCLNVAGGIFEEGEVARVKMAEGHYDGLVVAAGTQTCTTCLSSVC